jgi:arylsulfatase A-like enzyme
VAAICSPTRAALLIGRNPHAVGMGAVRVEVETAREPILR